MGEHDDTLVAVTEQAQRLLREAVTPARLKALLDTPAGFDDALWQSTSNLGWPAAVAAEEAGGLGLGWTALCQLTESLGAVTASLPLIDTAVLVDAIMRSASSTPATLERLVTGELRAATTLLEPGESSFAAPPATTYTDGRVRGRKSIAPFAAVADLALVSACDDQGLCLVVVELDQPGVRREIARAIDNARAAAALRFDSVVAHRLPGDARSARALLERAMTVGTVATAFEQVGGARACLDMACAYSRERKVFAQPIGRFQAIKHKLADIYASIEVARGCALDALARLEGDDPAAIVFAAAARLAATTAYERAATENVQVHGALGITWEGLPHHHYRRARALAVEQGNSFFWRDFLVDNVELLAEAY
jgi:alkylation response protein AidB-like acyl-CoA dehydrogenase